MIQVNLLPDVKREYLRAQQTKHMFTVISILTTIIAISLLVLLFAYVQVVQPRHRANLQKDIDSGITDLKKKNDAVKIVTVQGVLEQIPALQNKKLLTSNLFTYLTEFTPKDVSYSEIRLDLATNILSLSGQTTTLERANVLANNLKSASFSYKQNDTAQTLKPFSNIVFSNLGKSDEAQGNKTVSFQITFQIDSTMFNQAISAQKIKVNASSEELLLPSAQPFNETTNPGASQ
jgi:hypothetical protein